MYKGMKAEDQGGCILVSAVHQSGLRRTGGEHNGRECECMHVYLRERLRGQKTVMLSSYGVCRTSTDEVGMCNSRDSGRGERDNRGSEKVR